MSCVIPPCLFWTQIRRAREPIAGPTSSGFPTVTVLFLSLAMLAPISLAQEVGFDKASLDPNIYSREGQYENGSYRVGESRQLLGLTLESGVTMAFTPDANLFDSHVVSSMYLRGKADVAWLVAYDPATFVVTNYAQALPVATALSFTNSIYRGEKQIPTNDGWVVEPAIETHSEYDLPVSRYDFSASQIGGSTGWGEQPLALLLGHGHVIGVRWSGWLAGLRNSFEEFPAIIYEGTKFAEFSGGPFTDTSINPIGMTLVNSLTRLWDNPRTWTPDDGGVGVLVYRPSAQQG